MPPLRPLAAEAIGTAFLLIGVVGSGVMGDTLSNGNTAVALLANSIATGAILYVLITLLGPISGAHFNPVVTLAFRLTGDIDTRTALAYTGTQIAAGILGVWIAHIMFDLSILQLSTTERTGPGQWSAEVVAAFGLVFAILAGVQINKPAVPAIVALYITGAYWFTASTSFANPAVTIARSLTDTFAGILPAHAPGFIAAQIIGAILAVPIARYVLR